MQELEAPGDQETCPICQVMISPPFLVTIKDFVSPQRLGRCCRVDQKAPRVIYNFIPYKPVLQRVSIFYVLCFSSLKPSEQNLKAGADAGQEAASGKE